MACTGQAMNLKSKVHIRVKMKMGESHSLHVNITAHFVS